MEKVEAIMEAEKRRNRAILKVLIPITAIVVILAIVVGFIANTKGNRNTISANEFTEIAFHQKYQVTNIMTSDALEKKDLFKNALVTYLDEKNTVFFFEFKEKADAKSYFASVARKFKTEVKKSGSDNSDSINYENYCYYKANVDGKYMHVVRVKNTVLYANVDKSMADEVESLVRSIGY